MKGLFFKSASEGYYEIMSEPLAFMDSIVVVIKNVETNRVSYICVGNIGIVATGLRHLGFKDE